MNSIDYDILVLKEGDTFISYCPELDLSSCGESIEQAKDMLRTAVRLFLEEAEKMGSLEDILEESGYHKKDGGWEPPRLVATELASTK
jgi:predicted RNase H-like HicB family nuclease